MKKAKRLKKKSKFQALIACSNELNNVYTNNNKHSDTFIWSAYYNCILIRSQPKNNSIYVPFQYKEVSILLMK